MKPLITAYFLLFGLFVSAQNYFFIGENSYACTESFELKGGDYYSDLEVAFIKKGEGGLISLTTKTDFGDVYITGDVLIYLDNGTMVKCSEKHSHDATMERTSSIYTLTESDIKTLKNGKITGIRYSKKCGECIASTEEGSFVSKLEKDFNELTTQIKSLFK